LIKDRTDNRILNFEALFRLLSELYNWGPEVVKYYTLPQALVYVNQEGETPSSAFKKSIKFKSKTEAEKFLRAQRG